MISWLLHRKCQSGGEHDFVPLFPEGSCWSICLKCGCGTAIGGDEYGSFATWYSKAALRRAWSEFYSNIETLPVSRVVKLTKAKSRPLPNVSYEIDGKAVQPRWMRT